MNTENHSLLIVDDDLFTLSLMKTVLKGAGFCVRSASDVNGALNELSHFRPEMIISDYSMPGADGFIFRKILLKDKKLKHIPFVFLTTRDDDEFILKCYDLNITDFISKTISPQFLIARISRLLQTVQNRKPLVQQAVNEDLRKTEEALDREVPEFSGFSINHWHLPFSGSRMKDYFDYIQLDDSRLLVLIGHTSSYAWDARFISSAFTRYLQSIIKNFIKGKNSFSACELLLDININFTRKVKASSIFKADAVMLIDNQTNTVRYCSSGNTLPLLYYKKENDSVREMRVESAFPEETSGSSYSDVTVVLGQGDQLLIGSEGISADSLGPKGRMPGLGKLMETSLSENPGFDLLQSLQDEFITAASGTAEIDITAIHLTRL